MHFDSRKQRVERRRNDLTRAERGGADEDNLAAERSGGKLAAEHVGGRDVRKRAFAAAVAEEQVALAVERDPAFAERERRRVDVRDIQHRVARLHRRAERGDRQRGIDLPVELDHQRSAAKQAVGVGRGVEEPGSAGGLGQRAQAADRAGRVKERLIPRVVAAHDGQTERMLDTRAGAHRHWIERQRVSEYDLSGSQRVGEDGIGVASLVAIRFGEDDIEGDGRRPLIAERGNQPRHHVTAPRPLADRRETPLVDVDDDDPRIGRPQGRGAQQDVVGLVFEVAEQRRAIERKQRGDDGRNHPAPEGEARAALHRTVISTRRLRGSATLSAVCTSRSASPCEVASTNEGSRPASTSRLRIATARFIPSALLLTAVPVVSVCPMMMTSGDGRCFTASRMRGSSSLLSSVNSSESNL